MDNQFRRPATPRPVQSSGRYPNTRPTPQSQSDGTQTPWQQQSQPSPQQQPQYQQPSMQYQTMQEQYYADSPNTQPPSQPDPQVNPINDQPAPSNEQAKPKKSKKPLLIALSIVGSVIILIIACLSWYVLALRPVDSQASEKPFEIASGSTPSKISEDLKSAGIIRSGFAFMINARLQNAQGSLKAGKYSLSPAMSTDRVISELTKGPAIETVNITFLPGATLQDHKKELVKAGYTEEDIDSAFSANYDHPLFATKPASADLEGYIYGETHSFDKNTPLKTVLTRYFDDFYKVVEENNLAQAYEAQGLSLYEGITLASIIEREVSCGESKVCEDQKKVSQVFFKRLNEDISLGADATFVYAARKAGQTPSVNFDSPYNTRIHKGLPPGPISTPGLGALLAVANPTEGDYLYFVSGDDGVNYFARTEEEHIANTKKYCDVNCRLPQ